MGAPKRAPPRSRDMSRTFRLRILRMHQALPYTWYSSVCTCHIGYHSSHFSVATGVMFDVCIKYYRYARSIMYQLPGTWCNVVYVCKRHTSFVGENRRKQTRHCFYLRIRHVHSCIPLIFFALLSRSCSPQVVTQIRGHIIEAVEAGSTPPSPLGYVP